MKDNKVLSTAGLGISESNRLKTYCSLMQDNLVDQWHFEDEFVSSHLAFIDFEFLENQSKNFKSCAQVVVIVTKNNEKNPKYKYHINLPFTTNNVKDLLNDVSENYSFHVLSSSDSPEDNGQTNFTASLLSFGKSLFGDKEQKKIDLNKGIQKKYNRIITEKLSSLTPEINQLVFIGSPRSGKSKAIETVCEGSSINTDIYLSDDNTAINIDYGEITLNTKQIKLIGAPSKIKGDKEWRILTKQANAIVIMLDLSRPDPISYLEYYISFIKKKSTQCPVYCCFTHCDKNTGSMHELVLKIKSKYPELKGINHIDSRKKETVLKLLHSIYVS